MKWAYLDDSRTCSSSFVGDALLAGGQYNIGLASEALGNGQGEASIDRFSGNKSWASDGNKGSVNLSVILGLQSVPL